MKILQFLQFITITLAPLYILRFHFFIPFTFLEILIIITLLTTGYYFVKEGFNLKYFRTPFDLLIMFFLLSGIISVFITPDLRGGLGILKAYFIEPILFYYSVVFVTNITGSKHIIAGLIFSGLWLSLYAVLEAVFPSINFVLHEKLAGRVSAVYNSANSLALYIGPIILLVVGLITSGYQILGSKNKIFLYLVLLIITVALLLTKSKGGIIAEIIATGVLIYSLLALKHKILKAIWLIIPGILVISTAVFIYFLTSTYQPLLNTVNERPILGDTLAIRFVLWSETLNLIKDNFVFGAGLNGFKAVYSQNYKGLYAESLQYPHNIILNFWTETGLLGLLSFLGLVFVSINSILSKFRILSSSLKSHKQTLHGLAFVSILIFWLIHGIVDVPYFKNDLSLEFWTVLSLIAVWNRETKSLELQKE